MLFPALLGLALQSVPPAEEPARPKRDRAQALAKLMAVEDELMRSLYVARPWLAPVGDEADRSPELGAILQIDMDAWELELRRLESVIAVIDKTNLPPPRVHDARWMATWVRQERLRVASRPELNDSLSYAESLWLTIEAAARPAVSGVIPPSRIRNLGARLERVPEVWDTARRSLKHPSRPEALRAADFADRLARFIRENLRELAQRLPADEIDPYIEACDEAIEHTTDIADWWRERAISNPRDPRYISLTRWKQLVEQYTGWDVDVDELHLFLLQEISERRARVGKHAHALDVDDSVMTPTRIETGIVELATELARRARERGLVPPVGPDLEVRAVLASDAAREIARWEQPSFGRFRLATALPRPDWRAEMRLTRRAELAPAARPSLAARYGPVGELLLMWTALSSSSTTRVRLQNPQRRRAMGLYAVDWTLRTGLIEPRDERARAMFDRALLLEAARLLASLEMHAGLDEFEISVEHFAAHTGLDRRTAEQEVVQTGMDPLHGTAFLMYLDTLDLERSFREDGLDVAPAVRATIQVLLSHPSSPVRDLERPSVAAPEVGEGG